MNFNKVINKYRAIADSEREKGDLFEKLIKRFLLTYPVYNYTLSKVWLWNQFPYRASLSRTDQGIDLVGFTTDGEYWAVQCKCYAKDSPIIKDDVNTFVTNAGKFFKDDEGREIHFSKSVFVSTSNNWTENAVKATQNQGIEVSILNQSDLENAEIDWEALDEGKYGKAARTLPKQLKPHQIEAVKKFHEHFKTDDRGILCLPCGCGKTLTALKIAERETQGKGLVLVLAPSIALVGQLLTQWSNDAAERMYPICVCSDADASGYRKDADEDDADLSVVDLPIAASTDPEKIAKQLKKCKADPERLTVVFSTYQSTQVVSEASKKAKISFDLAVFDEAHMTAGAGVKGAELSPYLKAHSNEFIPAKKRLYMTATPKVYGENAKQKIDDNVILYDMGDIDDFGPTVYRMNFGEAVNKGLLSDYKVIVLTVSEDDIPEKLLERVRDTQTEIDTDDATKLIGCINALSKIMDTESNVLNIADPGRMHKAVAFCKSIKVSKRITEIFNNFGNDYYDGVDSSLKNQLVTISARHVDGTMPTPHRDEHMSWLKNTPSDIDSKECRILTNVKCLGVGVDVPSLDAVIFLSSKKSQIDIVQSVGRVMRLAPNKKYGYVIIPILIAPYTAPEKALDSSAYSIIWSVLNALKSHDDRFISLINKIRFNNEKPTDGGSVLIGGVPIPEEKENTECNTESKRLTQNDLFTVMEYKNEFTKEIYGKLVKKVGNKSDVITWAREVGDIASRYIDKIEKLIEKPGKHQIEFNKFLEVLKKNINPYIDKDELIQMISQHMVTKPVFESLFNYYSFIENNPISLALQGMVDLLESQAFEKDLKTLNKFYSDTDERIARLFVSGIDNSAARQKLIVDLYDNFFKIAFPDVVERLGIVYTPIEVVDFINNSVAEILQREFNRNISDENICFLDPFAGTGTFLTRLIQSGLLKDSLQRKYNNEMFCNEIVLLAYYIASINIENAYHEAMGENTEYQPFNGICLTDTFQLYEDEGTGLKIDALLKKNSDRVELQKNTPIMCIIGNPPYSAHQKSANDNAQNLSYPKLDNKISQTYATLSEATSKTSLYDSYIKSFRWATDRLNQNPNGGIIAFVSNAGWLDGNAMDGMRKCLVKDFSSIYVFNLRGNQRTSGELSRKEGGKIFGSGSRAPIAITFLVKNPDKTEHGQIFYYDIGDYLTREDKLSKIDNYKNIYSPDMIWETIIPNDAGDWLNQRSNLFSTFIQLGSKNNINLHTKTLFEPKYSLGLNTNRDSWCYNFSQISLIKNIKSAIQFFNDQSDNYSKINQTSLTPNIDDFIILDPTVFSWDRGRKNDLKNGKKYTYDVNSIVPSLYRPYQKQNCYFNRELNNYVALMPSLFPTQNHINLLICVSGVGVTKEFTTIITNILPDLELIGKSQCFPLYYYEKDNQTKNNILLPDKNYVEGYTRHDGITDFILNECQTKYDDNTRSINKKHIFYYVYGILHSQIYRETFSSDLKKMLPRIPLVDGLKDFIAFSNAGKKLADIHLNYESVEPYSKVNITGEEIGNFTVEKMRFGKDKVRKDDKSIIYYNDYITIKNIPLDAYKYIVNGKSAIEWIMERYQVTTHKESLIKNDPNDWAKEVENPRYIVDLLLRIITVSMETMKIVDSLPKLSFETTK